MLWLFQHHFVANYTERLNQTFFNTSINPKADSNQLNYGQYIYDAVYVIANVLHAVDTDKSNSSRFWLNYVYGSDLYGKRLRDQVVAYNQCGASVGSSIIFLITFKIYKILI